MYDIIAIGDATIDVFLILDEANVQCNLDKENCQLCINYADKIPVKSMTKVNAVGNAANHAVGMSRLGFRAAIYAIVGNDELGHGIVHQLRREGVSTRYVTYDKKRGTNYSTVIDYKGERTILVYHEQRDYQLPKLTKARYMYLTSMADGHEKIFPAVLEYKKKTGAKLMFNPGTFQLKLGIEKLAPILAETDVLFLNKEEGQKLVGDIHDVKELMIALQKYGPKIVALTDGQNGSYCFVDGMAYAMPIFEAPVVERTGCGDAFGSGFTAALAAGQSPQEAMRWGNINASGVIQHVGAQAGLYTRDAMKKDLAAHPEYEPKPLGQ